MKLFNLIFCALFICFAALQYNDPDPYIWIPIYLFVATICWLASRGRHFPRLCLTGMVLYGFYAIYLFFTDDGVKDWLWRHNAENIAGEMKATAPWIEDTREFFGLCILIFVLAVNYRYARKSIAVAGG